MDQLHQERDDHELSSPRRLLALLNANTIVMAVSSVTCARSGPLRCLWIIQHHANLLAC